MATKSVTDQSFATDVLGAPGPVLVDFWAQWCGPCRAIAPALEEISDELGDKVTIAKINIEDNPELPPAWHPGDPAVDAVQGRPAGRHKFEGAAPRSKIQQWLEARLAAVGDAAVKSAAP